MDEITAEGGVSVSAVYRSVPAEFKKENNCEFSAKHPKKLVLERRSVKGYYICLLASFGDGITIPSKYFYGHPKVAQEMSVVILRMSFQIIFARQRFHFFQD